MTPLERWRLALGRYAQSRLPLHGVHPGAAPRDDLQWRLDQALDFLYGREYRGRGVREELEDSQDAPDAGQAVLVNGDGGPPLDRHHGREHLRRSVRERADPAAGTLDPSQLTVVNWLSEVRALFPKETSTVIEKHALQRYGLTGLVTDPATLARLEPNQALLRMLLALRGQLHGEVLDVARRIIRRVVEELRRKLEPEIRQTFAGRINRFRHSPMAATRNFDVHGTIRANLHHFDRQRQQMVVENLRFFQRNSRRLPWDIILCIDQSGSMVDSLIHSAVMAGILAALPAFRVRIVVFDTNVVDLSDHVDDPVETLLSVQLGGGTHIAQALRYCTRLVEHPQRTVLALVSDFCEGAPPGQLLKAVKALAEARVTLIGLAALDEQANPAYDRQMAQKLAEIGMEIAALTPGQLAQWLLKVIS